MMICFGVGCGACIALRFYLPWQNRLRDGVGDVLDVDGTGIDGSGSSGGKDGEIGEMDRAVPGAMQVTPSLNLADKTDKEIPQFRYLY